MGRSEIADEAARLDRRTADYLAKLDDADGAEPVDAPGAMMTGERFLTRNVKAPEPKWSSRCLQGRLPESKGGPGSNRFHTACSATHSLAEEDEGLISMHLPVLCERARRLKDPLATRGQSEFRDGCREQTPTP